MNCQLKKPIGHQMTICIQIHIDFSQLIWYSLTNKEEFALKKRVEWIWNQLEKKLTAEQVFYLLLMLLFSSYFEHKLIGHNPDVNLSEGDLRSLFKQVHPAAR